MNDIDTRPRRLRLLAIALAWAAFTTAPVVAQERTLVLALDGVSYRFMEEARARGAFDGWAETKPLVSTFPSLTNVAFTAIFEPFHVDRADGYEVQYYDVERNMIVGGSPFGYRSRAMPWRSVFDVTSRSIGSKLSVYTSPRRYAWKELEEGEKFLLESPHDLVLSHVGGTDAMMHIRGEDAVVDFLVELDGRLEEIRARHAEVRGGTLRIVLLSDHGNSTAKIHSASGIRKKLRRVGLNPTAKLEEPNDVIAATFGLVGYGAMFTSPHHTEKAARAVVRHKSVEIASWLSGERSMTVIARKGEAVVRWEDRGGRRYFSYERLAADPLDLSVASDSMRQTGRTDERGFASEDDWFELTATGTFPDPMRRLVNAHTGLYVRNTATVFLSMKHGYAWGWRSAHASSVLQGGRLEGTHGALDRDSSLGFFLTESPSTEHGVAVRADRALIGIVGDEAIAQRSAPTGSGESSTHTGF